MQELSILDQLPFMNFYTQILVCFPLDENINQAEVVADLERGLQSLIHAFPFVNKQVVLERDPESKVVLSGVLKLAPRDNPNESLLRVRQLAGQISSYEQISKSKAPASLLDGDLLAPMKSLSAVIDFAKPAPVLVIQANFVAGGILLCFAAMHNVFDGTGLGKLIRHFATVCRGEKISDADLAAGNLARFKLFPMLGPDEISEDHSMMQIEAADKPSAPSDGPAILIPWTYFGFSAAKLEALKAEASPEASTNSEPSWISTNDAITALLWRSLVAPRLPRLKQESISTVFRPVNGLKSAGVPHGYMGVGVLGATNQLPLIDLTHRLHISEIARLLRKTVQSIDAHHVRSWASLLQSEPDKRKISFVLPSPENDAMISSWASLPIHSSDFGPRLGKPEFVRRPSFGPFDGLVFIMPRDLKGDIDVAICMNDNDLGRLKKDPVWMSYAALIG